MIDLHIHTNYSDGTDTLKDILIKADELNLEIISITDHENSDAHRELQSINAKEYFKGKIIVGCEFYVAYNKSVIEVLGYNFDIEVVDRFLKDFYLPEKVKLRNEIKYNNLIKKLDELGFIYDMSNLHDKRFEKRYEKIVYEEIIKYKENLTKIDEDVFSSLSNFFRKGLTNPESKLFLNYSQFRPSLDQIITLIHKANGVVFLAHPFIYGFKDTKQFLNTIYRDYNLDGIECYYTTISQNQINYLLGFAKEHKLLVCGGSDYHGDNKKKHNLGTGNNNLSINKEILNNWPIG